MINNYLNQKVSEYLKILGVKDIDEGMRKLEEIISRGDDVDEKGANSSLSE